MRKLLLTLGLASVLGIAAIVGLRADSSAGGPTFANNILNGRYSFHGEGSWSVDATDVDAVFDSLGVVTYNGNGGLVAKGTFTIRFPFNSAAGLVCTYKTSGTYIVNPDGTGTTKFHSATTSAGCVDVDGTEDFVISTSGGKALSSVYTSLESTPFNVFGSVSGSTQYMRQ